jgi:hypothetical protein
VSPLAGEVDSPLPAWLAWDVSMLQDSAQERLMIRSGRESPSATAISIQRPACGPHEHCR